MNKHRFLRFAAFALCIEFALIVVLFVSTSNPTTTDVLPTQMVLPVVPTPLPQTEVVSNEGSQNGAAAPVDVAGQAAEQGVQAVSVEDSSSPVGGNTNQPLPATPESQQPAVVPPSNEVTKPTQIPLPPQVPIPNQVVVQFKADAKPEEINAYVASVGGTVNHKIDALNTVVINLPPAQIPQALPAAAAIVNTEPDYLVSALVDVPPSDPLYSQQWSLPVISASDGWNVLPADAPKVTIAVIDSGICADHLDLKGRVLPGWDFVENDAVPQDEYGHGCAVAGIIAANIDDGAGIAGVAPNAMILPLRVLDGVGVGTYSNVAAAIVRAADEGAQIINLSVGGSNASSVLENAIDYAIAKHVTVVAAAGNTGGNVLYPAAYAPVISVGSVDANLQRSSFSSYLPQLDTLAPGSNILTTALNQSYKTVSGTSFAAAEVSGIIALDMGAGYPVGFDGSVLKFGPQDSLATLLPPSGTLISGDPVDGEVQPLAVIGPDSRVRVTDTTVSPNSAVVLIVFQQGVDEFNHPLNYICSGSVIAPQYVLTAGHCAYEGGIYSTNITVYPGLNGSYAPFGSRSVTSTYIPPTWINTATGDFSNANLDYDWALLQLSSPVSTSIQPFAVGTYSNSFLTSGVNFTDAGYPGDKCRYAGDVVTYCYPVGPATGVLGNGDTQWTAFNTIFTALTYRVGSKIDTYGGQSGSPFYYVDTTKATNVISRNVVVGVLSYSEVYGSTTCYNTPGAQCPEANSGNYFRRVTNDMLEAMVTSNNVPFVNPNCYAVDIVTSGLGTVSRSQARSVGMGCATGTYTTGTVLGLSAVASPGWVFSGWSSGTASNDVNTTYTVTGAATLTATFIPQPPPPPSTVLPVGFYDDRDVNITYSAGWTAFNGTGPSANTVMYTNVQNAIATFAFNGTGIILYRTLGSNRGPMEVCIDSSCQTINSFSTTGVWTSPTPTLDSGSVATRVVRIRNLSGSFIDLDAVAVLGPPVPLGIGSYQENNSNFTYNGVWTTNTTSLALGGSWKYTKDPVGKVSFDITNAVGRIVIYRTTYLASTYGSMEVYVDGGLAATIDNTSSSLLTGMPVVVSVSPTGHNIELRNVGSTYSVLDQISLLSTSSPLSAGNYQETDPSLIYNGIWTDASTTSALGNAWRYTNDANGTVSFAIDNTVGRVTIYRTTYLAGVYGSFQVFLDGSTVPVATIDNTSSTFMFQKPFTFFVTPGNHIVTLKNMGSTYSVLDQITLQAPLTPLSVGTYQESDSNLSYSGNWITSNTTSALGNSWIYTNDANASVSFGIDNTVGRVTIYRTTYAAGVYGSFQVYVDGVLVTTINNTSSTFMFQQPYTFVVTPGSHNIMLKNVGSTYSVLDQITLQAPLTPLSVGTYQETEARLVYNGAWTDVSTSSALGNSWRYTNDANANVSFTIDNTVGRVTIYRTTYAVGVYGSFQVYVDGVLVTTINNTSSTFMFQQPYTFVVTPGSHNIMLKNVGSLYGVLDQITLQAPLTPLSVGTYQETEARLVYNGAWTDVSTSSALGNSWRYTNDANANVSFTVDNTVGKVTIYRTTYAAGVYGSFQVFVDGVLVTTIDNTSSTFLTQQPASFVVTAGNHTITLKNVGSLYGVLDQITLLAPGAQAEPILPTATLTPTVATATLTLTPTSTQTGVTVTATSTLTVTETPVETVTPTQDATLEPTQTTVPSETVVPSVVPSETPIPTASPIPTGTPVPTVIPSSTPPPTAVPTNTAVPTAVPTNTVVPTDIPTNTPIPTDVPTETASAG
ncbi:MAG: S8 family serine peptidase [Anaerolineaceae bacterium]|nr:S8 family serine peptidase [Anaerolineaceae bacterium]